MEDRGTSCVVSLELDEDEEEEDGEAAFFNASSMMGGYSSQKWTLFPHRAAGLEVGFEKDVEADNEQAQGSSLPFVEIAVEAFPPLPASRKVTPEEHPVLAMALAPSVAGMPSDLHLVSGRATQEVDSMAVRTAAAVAA
jgi:hypothetical protein